jgi:hypothetical protein
VHTCSPKGKSGYSAHWSLNIHMWRMWTYWLRDGSLIKCISSMADRLCNILRDHWSRTVRYVIDALHMYIFTVNMHSSSFRVVWKLQNISVNCIVVMTYMRGNVFESTWGYIEDFQYEKCMTSFCRKYIIQSHDPYMCISWTKFKFVKRIWQSVQTTVGCLNKSNINVIYTEYMDSMQIDWFGCRTLRM